MATSESSNIDGVGFLLKTMMERDPSKRRVKLAQQSLWELDFDAEESSDDEDFCIEGHETSSSSGVEKEESELESDEEKIIQSDEKVENFSTVTNQSILSTSSLLQKAKDQAKDYINLDLSKTLICSVCLENATQGSDEVVECDSCGISVHEVCYGVNDSASISSSSSSCSTEPWFCDACRAGVTDPDCQLCPNKGGVFKETDVGQWVHLICALYIPGIAFSEVDRLSGVTLFELPYGRWGNKVCSLCTDQRFSRTGICISCDAGLCKTYFHATCAQREGLLQDGHYDENTADPFYAHCKLHSDSNRLKLKKRNWLALQAQLRHRRDQRQEQQLAMMNGDVEYSPAHDLLRIQRKLDHKRERYMKLRAQRPFPWVPTQKLPRLINTSPTACKQLLHKGHLMGLDVSSLESQDALIQSVEDINRKWHIPPAFSVEFVYYFVDRQNRMVKMRENLEHLLHQHSVMRNEEQLLRPQFDVLQSAYESLHQKATSYHNILSDLCNKLIGIKLQLPHVLSSSPVHSQSKQNLNNEDVISKCCSVCLICIDQHLLVTCDVCKHHYHLHCLDPPLTRMPKKSKLYGWQCSECLQCSDPETVDTDAPRSLRKSSKDAETFLNITSSNLFRSRKRKKNKCSNRTSKRKQPEQLLVNGTERKRIGSGKLHDIRTHCDRCAKAGNNNDLVRCDCCFRCYHFSTCLNPPCSKNPKPRGYSWFCDDCDASDQSSNTNAEFVENGI